MHPSIWHGNGANSGITACAQSHIVERCGGSGSGSGGGGSRGSEGGFAGGDGAPAGQAAASTITPPACEEAPLLISFDRLAVGA